MGALLSNEEISDGSPLRNGPPVSGHVNLHSGVSYSAPPMARAHVHVSAQAPNAHAEIIRKFEPGFEAQNRGIITRRMTRVFHIFYIG